MHAVGNVSDERLQKCLKLYDRMSKNYKDNNVQTAGHSVGSVLSFFVGRQKGSHSASFNPGLSPFKHKSKTLHDGHLYIFRTVDDPVRLGCFQFEDMPNIDTVHLSPILIITVLTITSDRKR